MIMAIRTQRPNEDGTIAKALAPIDPQGTLVQGTPEYDRIIDLLQCWIDQCGKEYALCMAQVGAKHLDRWRKFL
jgi:hypothetical protein